MRLHSLRLLVMAAVLSTPLLARAQVFYESWENGSGKWHAVDGGPINLTTDANLCSSTFQRETTLYAGGRVFTSAGIAVTGGMPYCLTSWIRGSANSQPFIGINLSDVNGTPGTEHWLTGNAGFPNSYGGSVNPVASDGQWHWYATPFTMDAGATYVVIKDEIFNGGSAGTADFDDIQLWAGACPAHATGASHVACTGADPVCLGGATCVQCATGQTAACTGATAVCNTTSNVCVGCLANTDCTTPDAPICDAGSQSCRACASDTDCSGATPACQQSGACGQCSQTNTSMCQAPTAVCSATGTCAACVTLSNGDAGQTVLGCANSSSGHVCIDTGTGPACGCDSDSDCGAADSGLICNGANSTCVAGCRAQGGNTCPAGSTCTASGSGTGTCVVMDDSGTGTPDAGTPDLANKGVDMGGGTYSGGCSCRIGRSGPTGQAGEAGSSSTMPAAPLAFAVAFLVLALRRRSRQQR